VSQGILLIAVAYDVAALRQNLRDGQGHIAHEVATLVM
jgi:hypothetical protein